MCNGDVAPRPSPPTFYFTKMMLVTLATLQGTGNVFHSVKLSARRGPNLPALKNVRSSGAANSPMSTLRCSVHSWQQEMVVSRSC